MSTLDQTFAALTAPSNRGRVLLLGVIMASVVGAFAYTGGWLSASKLTPKRMIDGFEQVNGPHPGFRRNHAKGVGVSGYFEASGQGAKFSRAAVFKQGARATVIGRFALAGGMPYAMDTEQNVRSLALLLAGTGIRGQTVKSARGGLSAVHRSPARVGPDRPLWARSSARQN